MRTRLESDVERRILGHRSPAASRAMTSACGSPGRSMPPLPDHASVRRDDNRADHRVRGRRPPSELGELERALEIPELRQLRRREPRRRPRCRPRRRSRSLRRSGRPPRRARRARSDPGRRRPPGRELGRHELAQPAYAIERLRQERLARVARMHAHAEHEVGICGGSAAAASTGVSRVERDTDPSPCARAFAMTADGSARPPRDGT